MNAGVKWRNKDVFSLSPAGRTNRGEIAEPASELRRRSARIPIVEQRRTAFVSAHLHVAVRRQQRHEPIVPELEHSLQESSLGFEFSPSLSGACLGK